MSNQPSNDAISDVFEGNTLLPKMHSAGIDINSATTDQVAENKLTTLKDKFANFSPEQQARVLAIVNEQYNRTEEQSVAHDKPIERG